MLQQTTVAAVGPYFERFLKRWPRVADLAVAPLDDVLTEWAGLGYYARARNLHACATAVVAQHGGHFPGDFALLSALPGIGAYTAGAVAAIAFDIPAAAIDGNAERVIAARFIPHQDAATRRQTRIAPAGRSAGPTKPPRRFRTSADGSGRHHLYAA